MHLCAPTNSSHYVPSYMHCTQFVYSALNLQICTMMSQDVIFLLSMLSQFKYEIENTFHIIRSKFGSA